MHQNHSLKHCRICNNYLTYLTILKNIPKAAQSFSESVNEAKKELVDIELFQCSGCGVVQLIIPPVPYYREVIRVAGLSHEMESFRFRQFCELIKKFNLKEKKIIEIGCGRGDYLKILNKFSELQVFGLEYNVKSVQECRTKGFNVIHGFPSNKEYQIDYSPFDGFVMFNFLEHIPTPNSFLRAIYNNLNESAIGLIEVPNFDMIIEKQLFAEFIPDHLFYYTQKTLTTVLEINGFEVLKCQPIWHNYIISAIVRKRPLYPLIDFSAYVDKLRHDLMEFVARFNGKPIAVWGAGHQGLAILSITEVFKHIKYVVDSALFKQGKYTPGTGLRIVSPMQLKKEPVEAVIVMAGSYSDEIIQILARDFRDALTIAVLKEDGLKVLVNENKIMEKTHADYIKSKS